VIIFKTHINKSDEFPFEIHHIPLLQIKVMYLQYAYEFALDDMPNGASWKSMFCEQSINFLQKTFDKIHCIQTLQS